MWRLIVQSLSLQLGFFGCTDLRNAAGSQADLQPDAPGESGFAD
jgi:hypothetical protein